MTDYSQTGEQAAILSCFPDVESGGRLLDIGAWNATDKSNTRALFERGWGGVLVEPSPGPMKGLIEAYGKEERIALVQALVMPERQIGKLYVTDDAVSTSSQGQYEKWKEFAKFAGSIYVPAITWTDIATQFGGFDFVSIDAEGLSVELFQDMLTEAIYPPCVCVEHDDRLAELLGVATHEGYQAILVNGNNAVLKR